MIRVNLMPRAEARRQAARQRDRRIAVAIAALVAATVLLAEIVSRGDARIVEADAKAHKAELTELTRRHTEAVRLDKKRKELEAKLKTIDILERQRTGPVRVLDDLSGATPDKLWVTSMKEAGGSMTVKGRGLDNQTIALFMRNLGRSRYFDGVDLVETLQVEEGKAKLKEFTIRASVVYAGRADAAKNAVADAAAQTSAGATPPAAPQAQPAPPAESAQQQPIEPGPGGPPGADPGAPPAVGAAQPIMGEVIEPPPAQSAQTSGALGALGTARDAASRTEAVQSRRDAQARTMGAAL